ncbi:hypothetical protein PDE_06341 [Penicillium oxalicum 114-2]|uniref:Uncharacterized protein n=1 Tax=Penicillium oxalicum (strain 114-2 / CGMCC 5302) TaxID=933388 RepID=S7ZRT2_PENO1|nr:hypothetical protein PDE_06341 [Penicillium oxalicum 114-2]
MKFNLHFGLALILAVIQIAMALPNVALRAVTADPLTTSDSETELPTLTPVPSATSPLRWTFNISLPTTPVTSSTSPLHWTFTISLPTATHTDGSSSGSVSPGVPVVTTIPSSSGVTSPVSNSQKMTTSVIYTTSEITVTKCATTVTDCPADSTTVITSTIPLTTTVCPITESTTQTAGNGASSSSEIPSSSTSDVKASPTAVPVKGTTVTTEVYTTTTVCPVTTTVISGTHTMTSVYSTVSTVTVVPAPATALTTFETTTVCPVTETFVSGSSTHTITTSKVSTVTVTNTIWPTVVPPVAGPNPVVTTSVPHASSTHVNTPVGASAGSTMKSSGVYPGGHSTYSVPVGPTQSPVFNAATSKKAVSTLVGTLYAMLVLVVL